MVQGSAHVGGIRPSLDLVRRRRERRLRARIRRLKAREDSGGQAFALVLWVVAPMFALGGALFAIAWFGAKGVAAKLDERDAARRRERIRRRRAEHA